MSTRKIVIQRVSIAMLVGLLIGVLISEVSYLFLKETNRPPERVEIVIPTLVVTNQDVTDHELGPLWIPPGTSASLNLDQAEAYAFSCSFQPTKYLGIDVREPVTLVTRLIGIIVISVPLGALFSVYSLVAWPLKEKEKSS